MLLFFCIALPIISYLKFRSVLHPHVIFTVSWIYLLPLGPVVNAEPSNDIERLWNASNESLLEIHGIMSVFFVLLYATTFFYASYKDRLNKQPNISFKSYASGAKLIGSFGVALLFTQLLRQLGSSDWSFDLWLHYLLGPRFGRPWMGAYIGGGEFFFTLLGNLFPIAGILLAYSTVFTKSNYKWLFFVCMLFQLFILVGNGSRTPMALTCLCFGVFWWLSKKGIERYIGATLSLATVIFLISLMSQFRHEGISSMQSAADVTNIEYKQDDNYYRLMNVFLVENDGNVARWSAKHFIGSAIVNPIPRFFWPGKPLLEQSFYGEWKAFYVTITFVGEFIAMFGISMGITISLVVGFGFYCLLQTTYTCIKNQGGIIFYLGTAFYIYSVMRSITNLGMNMVFFTAIIALYLYLNKFHRNKIPMKKNRKLSI